MKKLQIGVIGSCSDLEYSDKAEKFARNIGKIISKRGYVLVYGAEKDINSLPTIAVLEAKKYGGMTVGVTYEKGMDLFENDAAEVVIVTGMVRGGGRETRLMLSCDAVIAISGGSGTLNEICVAYQANIPVVVIDLFGGWSKKLSNEYLDDRKRYKCLAAKSPSEALNILKDLVAA